MEVIYYTFWFDHLWTIGVRFSFLCYDYQMRTWVEATYQPSQNVYCVPDMAGNIWALGSFIYLIKGIFSCGCFLWRYNPPLIWGRSGHLQTIIHSTLSRHKAPREKGDSRHAILLSDGTTVTFDLFLPPTELNQKETRTGQGNIGFSV